VWKRIGALVRKEFVQLRRDRRTLAMMILLPILWLVAFGYAVNFDVPHLKVFVVDRADNGDSRDVIDRIDRHDSLEVVGSGSEEDAVDRIKDGTADVILVFPEAFEFPAKDEDSQLKIQVDGSRLFTAQSAVRELNDVLKDLQKDSIRDIKEELEKTFEKSREDSLSLSLSGDSPLSNLPPQAAESLWKQIESRVKSALEERMEERKDELEKQLPDPEASMPDVDVLYNADLKSVHYMIPGLVGLVLIFITTLMTALGVVREKERGTLEQLIVSPLRPFELMLGKVLPYMIIATLDFAIVFAAGVYWFDVPFRGDLFSFILVALLFLFSSLGMGLLVSTVSQNQQQAMQLAVMTLVPQILLSGFIFPLEAMPWGIRWIAYVLPLSYFLPISRDVFLKGMSAWDYPLEFAVLAFFGVFFLLVATIRFRRSLT
jgi:ABC-2 type transport system permease protein